MGKGIWHRRGLIQGLASLLSNIHLPNFLKGTIDTGAGKYVCVPGLNCYSCPGAAGACPIGALQAVIGSSKFHVTYYVTGIILLFGVLLGRLICGFLCPFGWFQDLLHRIPGQKYSTKGLKGLRYGKYLVLFVFVIGLPMVIHNSVGLGNPWFCKYICPQGILEGAIPLALKNPGIRAALGGLFAWKSLVLAAVVVLSILFYRPFCKWLCPLGAIYAMLQPVSLLHYQVDKERCISCGKCARLCQMDVDITRHANHSECIRCGACIRHCPTKAIRCSFGLGCTPQTNKTITQEETAL